MAAYDVMIIGGGASGLMAAAQLAGSGMHTLVLEQSDRVGRKLLATGNGRCNVLNMRMGSERYFSHDMDMAMDILGAHEPERILDLFMQMGLLTREEEDGRVYPLSGQAASVLDTLRLTVQERGADIECQCAVTGIERAKGMWRAHMPDGRMAQARRVVLACGGRAQPTPPADRQAHADIYGMLKALGHKVYEPRPVLSALRCDMSALRGLKGVRARCAMTMLDAGERRVLARDEGEALFTDYGVSGIVAMQLSRALDGRSRAVLHIDLLPGMSEDEVRGMLRRRAANAAMRPLEGLMTGMLNRLLAQCVIRQAGLKAGDASGTLDAPGIAALAGALKRLRAEVLGAQDFKSAQVMRGGAALSGFSATLESKSAPGLYACGEVLDVDGECGGYNLMWAWASALTVAEGICAGQAARGLRSK